MVYEKSALGFNEFTANNRTLSVRERQVLLLVNGERDLGELEKFFKKEVLFAAIKKLESNGYIQLPSNNWPSNQSQPTTQSFFDSQSLSTTICPNKLIAIKNILSEATDDYLGIMGRSIKVKIEACDNESDLRQCISTWHMAMRESKLGRESANFLMEQIHQTLENRTVHVAINQHATH